MVKISVVVPVYNVEQYIGDCLESLLNQTYSTFEVLFVDDCGNDSSISIIETFLASHKYFDAKIINHEHNKGLSGARNTGLKAATGDYVYFLDSDDKIPSDALEKLAAPLENCDVDFILGNYDVFGDMQMNSDLFMSEGLVHDVLRTYVEGKWYVMAWNKLCKRSFLLENNLWFKEGYIHEDQIWSFMLACTAKSMYVVADITYDYRVRASSIMTGMGIRKDAMTYVRVYDALREYIVSNSLTSNGLVYRIFEGKRSGILYSLLEKNEVDVYKDAYNAFYEQVYVRPFSAFRSGLMDFKTLLRDVHYALPMSAGRLYKKMFYWMYYKMLRKPVEGLVWK